MNGANALSSLNSGEYKIFYTDNNGREGMIIWLDALAIKIFGNELWALRFFPALAGVLAVLGLYFLSKELFGIKIALASSFFMAVSFWAVNFSRMGFRANLMLPFLIWSFYFLYYSLKLLIPRINSFGDKMGITRFYFIIAGVLFGLGFFTYISYRFAPILLAIYFLPYLIKHGSKKIGVGFLLFLLTTLIVALPIGIYFLNNPGDFFGRSGQVSVFSSDNPIKAIAISLVTTLGMFNVLGDLNWRHNFSGSPQLLWPVGLLFILGIFISFKNFKWQDKFLLSWLFIFLLPNILTTEGNPHALRALGTLPAAMVFSGIGLIWIYEKYKKFIDNKIKNADLLARRNQFQRIKKESFLLLAVFLFFIAAIEFDKYFLRWPQNPRTIDAFSKNQVEISKYLNGLPNSVLKYVVWHVGDKPTSNELPVSAQTVYFLSYGKSNINYVKADEFDKIKLGENNTVIAPLYFDLELIHELNKKFPEGKIEFIYLNT
ncbi:MAG: glycosyltransferase family 39 protein, partial [Patescibacteria group bacterium]